MLFQSSEKFANVVAFPSACVMKFNHNVYILEEKLAQQRKNLQNKSLFLKALQDELLRSGNVFVRGRIIWDNEIVYRVGEIQDSIDRNETPKVNEFTWECIKYGLERQGYKILFIPSLNTYFIEF